MNVFLWVCMFIMCVTDAHRGQKGASGLLELAFPTVAVGAENKPVSSARAASALGC